MEKIDKDPNTTNVIETLLRRNMGSSPKLLRLLRDNLLRRPTRREIVVQGTGTNPGLHQELIKLGCDDGEEDSEEGNGGLEPIGGEVPDAAVLELPGLNYTEEDEAAVKIQAAFRGHLARRAFMALRSLVRLQALARGAYVRKQTEMALRCMHVLVRLQVRVRARQLFGNFDG